MSNESEAPTEEQEAPQADPLGHVAQAGKEALTDDMVARLGFTASELMDLADRVNRSEVTDALPILERMVQSGDLQRVANLARLVGAGEQALTDDMIARLGHTASETMDLVDRATTADIQRALPILERLLDNGDLAQVADLARLISAAREAMTDDMIARLADNATEALALVDRLRSTGLLDELIQAGPALSDLMARLNTPQGDSGETLITGLKHVADNLSPETLNQLAAEAPRLVEILDQVQKMHVMEDFLRCMHGATEDVAQQPKPKGGIMGLLKLAKMRETQELLQFVVYIGKHFRECRLDRNQQS